MKLGNKTDSASQFGSKFLVFHIKSVCGSKMEKCNEVYGLFIFAIIIVLAP